MNSRHYHTPITDSQRKRCPICDKPVYSLAGIHPQCAIKQNDGVPPILNEPVDPVIAVATTGTVAAIKSTGD
jgi:hypothetical protein